MHFESFHSSSAGNLYRITAGGLPPLLIECGVSIARIRHALDYRLADIGGCLVSHAHGDHSRSAKDLIALGIDIYCSEDTAVTLGIAGHPATHFVESGIQATICGWRVVPFECVHDAPCLGYLISDDKDKLLFAVDTAFIRVRFTGLTHICIEANFGQDYIDYGLPLPVIARLFGNHMGIETLVTFLKAQDLSALREVHLLHLSDRNSNAVEFQRMTQGVTGVPVYVARA